MVYLFISFIVLLVSYLLFRKVAGSLKLTQLNMISWIFYFNLIGQMFVSSILIVNNLENHYIFKMISDPTVRLHGYMAIQYTMITLPLGMLFTTYLFGLSNNRLLFKNYTSGEIVPLFSKKDSYIRIPLYIATFVSIFSVTYVIMQVGSVAVLEIFKGLGSNVLLVARQDASRNFTGNVYIRNILALGLTPILSFIAFSYYKMTRKTFDMVWFLFLFISSIIILTYNFEKSPVIFYFSGFSFLERSYKRFCQKKDSISFFWNNANIFNYFLHNDSAGYRPENFSQIGVGDSWQGLIQSGWRSICQL